MREEIKIKLLQNMLREVTKKYDYFISLQEETLKETFEKAIRDSLTGLYNRNYLIDRLKTLLAKAKRKEAKIILVFLDLNNFKKVNDTYGHERGDEVLKGVANLLKNAFREYDLIARYGGDEFVVVIEGNEQKIDIKNIIKRLNEKLYTEFKNYHISIAYGIATSDETTDLNTLITLADERMYENKSIMKTVNVDGRR